MLFLLKFSIVEKVEVRNESDRRNCKETAVKTLDGMETRPTTDRIKETLFNMIAPSVFGSVFLDLFAGSGGIGIEALSRGAKEAVFVEKNPKAMACVKENLNYTKLSEKAMTMTKDVLTALYQLEGEKCLILYLWILRMIRIWRDRFLRICPVPN